MATLRNRQGQPLQLGFQLHLAPTNSVHLARKSSELFRQFFLESIKRIVNYVWLQHRFLQALKQPGLEPVMALLEIVCAGAAVEVPGAPVTGTTKFAMA